MAAHSGEAAPPKPRGPAAWIARQPWFSPWRDPHHKFPTTEWMLARLRTGEVDPDEPVNSLGIRHSGTLLFVAATDGNYALAEGLIEAGATMDFPFSWTPLTALAAREPDAAEVDFTGRVRILKLLARSGANMNDHRGVTGLFSRLIYSANHELWQANMLPILRAALYAGMSTRRPLNTGHWLQADDPRRLSLLQYIDANLGALPEQQPFATNLRTVRALVNEYEARLLTILLALDKHVNLPKLATFLIIKAYGEVAG
jgi:hypothetical protein